MQGKRVCSYCIFSLSFYQRIKKLAIVVQGTQLVFCRHVQVTPAQTVFGAIMWGFGFAVDVQSDLILQNLRRRNPQQGVSMSSSLSSLHALTCP